MAKLYYQGHGSYRITSDGGVVVYVDPYAGGGYDIPADIVLVTHQHGDHNQLGLVTKKPDCAVVTEAGALTDGKYNSFSLCGIEVEAVEAGNKMHNREQCVGYLITVDGKKIYASGDTSKTKQMETFADKKLDYAILCCDGIFNMGLNEAAECAAIIGAAHNIPVHMKPGALFSRKKAESWAAPDKLILEPDEEITL